MPFQPIQSASVAEATAAQIRELIAEDVLRPGDRLPSERELCEHMQVSRTSLREAVKALISEKLLESRRGAGLFVSAQVGADLTSPLRSLIEAQPRAMTTSSSAECWRANARRPRRRQRPRSNG